MGSLAVTSDITSSGNISASGTVFTTNIATPDIPTVSGNIFGTSLTIKPGRGFGSGANAGDLFLKTSQGMGTGTGGNIIIQPGGGGTTSYASGSINLNSSEININGAVNGIHSTGEISASGNNAVVAFQGHFDNSISVGGVNINTIYGDARLAETQTFTGQKTFSAPITASIISASGNIIAPSYTGPDLW